MTTGYQGILFLVKLHRHRVEWMLHLLYLGGFPQIIPRPEQSRRSPRPSPPGNGGFFKIFSSGSCGQPEMALNDREVQPGLQALPALLR